MTTSPQSIDAAASTPVPLLDIGRQNHSLQDPINSAIRQVCESGAFVHGPACRELESRVAAYCGAAHGIGCASGSDALLLALMALEIGEGDEVLLPAFTFFATASAVWRVGATPVFVDIEPDSFNICHRDLESKITDKTRAVIVVHLFGQCANMMAIGELARKHDLEVIEDAAQSIGAEYLGRRAGSLGTVGCFSFYPSKNLGAFGDGGMITTSDEDLAARMRILRDHGQHPTYHHQFIGINSRLDTLQAAILGVKLSKLDTWAAQRAANAERYAEKFASAGLASQVIPPIVKPGCRSIWNQYTVRIPHGRRDAAREHLTKRNIGSAIYYPVPLHLQQCFAPLGYATGSLPVTEKAAGEVLSLPIFPELTRPEQDRVVNAIAEFFEMSATSDSPRRETAAHAVSAA